MQVGPNLAQIQGRPSSSNSIQHRFLKKGAWKNPQLPKKSTNIKIGPAKQNFKPKSKGGEKTNPVSTALSSKDIPRKPRPKSEEEIAMKKVVFDNMRKITDQSYADFQVSKKSTALLENFAVGIHSLPPMLQTPQSLDPMGKKKSRIDSLEKPPDLLQKMPIESTNEIGESSSGHANSAMQVEPSLGS
ncbi:hypothetical protein PIB30_045270 [Stylosanthes scabra]|uniref:Uncharacterized protein n=1 Tax=Stylosanthes scabra TaxID=79078 RepID=A0ABU6RGS6_9FABA|nr:hypothetical protein [Stylosanthes scabra]